RSVSLQMMAGGILLTVAGTLRGEWHGLDLAHATLQSFLAWLYLIAFGSIVAFSAYTWLLSVVPSAIVSTYAFVNPVIAVLLGAMWLGEPIGPRVLLASLLIVGAVAIVVYSKAREAKTKAAAATAS